MIGVDTNIIVRLLTRDDEGCHAPGGRLFLRNFFTFDKAFVHRAEGLTVSLVRTP